MLLINKNSNNTMILTLTEKSTLVSPYYLFKFTNDLTRESVSFISADLSSYTDRYNKFLVTETSGTVNLTSGVINLSPTGYWKYSVYEQTSSTNLNSNLSTGLVESGKVKVVGTDTTHSVYNPVIKKYIGYGKGSS